VTGTAVLNYNNVIVNTDGTPNPLFITQWNSLRTDIGKAMGVTAATAADLANSTYTAARVGAVPRSGRAKLGDIVSARDFGAVGDGASDDTASLQAWLNSLALTGGRGVLPAGSYKVTAGLTLNLSAQLVTNTRSVSIEGDGAGCTELKWAGSAGGTILSITSSASSSAAHWHSKFSGFRLATTGPTCTGLTISDCAFALFEGILANGLDRGFSLTDVLSTRFVNLKARFCREGLVANAKVNLSNPNALDFFGCHFGTCGDFGASFTNCCDVHFFGGSFEGCGRTGSATDRFGIKFQTPGNAGGAAATFYGTHFENNATTADVWLNMGANSANLAVRDCSFDRLDATTYTDHCVRIDQGPTDGVCHVDVSGSSFRGYAPYVSDPSRAFVQFFSTGAFRLYDVGTYYDNLTERPGVSGNQASARCTFNGADAVPVPTKAHNVASILKNGTGDYTITFMEPANAGRQMAGNLNAAGVLVKFAESTTTIRVRTLDLTGAFADFTQVGLVMY
jgi:hypothetical protein